MTQTGYHCSPLADLSDRLRIGDGWTFCVADDTAIARLYLRGGDAIHHLYTVEWDASDVSAAGEAEIIAAWRQVFPRREWDESRLPIWDAVKTPRVRAALLAAGYDALAYGDSHNGCDYETTEFLRRPASLRIMAREIITCEEEATNG